MIACTTAVSKNLFLCIKLYCMCIINIGLISRANQPYCVQFRSEVIRVDCFDYHISKTFASAEKIKSNNLI